MAFCSETMAGAIVFLIAPGEFVLLDAILLVLADGAECDQSGLYVLSHALLVDVERIRGLARENAVGDELLQIRGAGSVDAILVFVNASGRSISGRQTCKNE